MVKTSHAPRIQFSQEIQARLRDLPSSSSTDYCVAGVNLRLEFGSEEFRKNVAPALSHLTHAGRTDRALTIYLRDLSAAFPGEESLAQNPCFSGSTNDIWVDDAPDCFLAIQKSGQQIMAIDWKSGTGYWLVQEIDSMPYLDRSQPMLSLLLHCLAAKRRYLVHGAAVGNENGAVLILGHGGAGKSTTALLSLEDGLKYVGDDYCLVSFDKAPAVHSLYATGKISAEGLTHVPSLLPACEMNGRTEEEKVIFFFERIPTVRIARELPLRAILHARITETPRTRLRRIGSAEAFRTLLPCSALHFASARPAAVDCFSALARQLPAYALELGADLHSTPIAIRELLAGN